MNKNIKILSLISIISVMALVWAKVIIMQTFKMPTKAQAELIPLMTRIKETEENS